MIDIIKVIQTPAYDFLRNEDDLRHVIYLTMSGSHAYGTDKQGSDIDLRGVLVECPKYIYGIKNFEQFENLKTDTVIFGLQKFITLCVNANPNALELLGTNEECIACITPAGRLLREQTGLFLSQRAIQSFGNYAAAQLRRLSNALCRDTYSQTEQEAYIADTLNNQMEHFNRTYLPMDKGALYVYLSDSPEPELLFDVNLKGYPIRAFNGIYSEIANIIKTYGKLNHRNRKKDEPHLYKHAMHLIRLLLTGGDILKGNGIVTFRKKEHDLLMDIRNGAYSFDEIMDMAKKYQSEFEQIAKKTKLPKEPDMEKVEKLMQEIYYMELER